MRLGRLLRQILFWGIPLLTVFLVIVSGFIYWLLATPTGTRWALNTAAVQFDGESRGVRGSVWHGVSVDHLTLNLPNQLFIQLEQAQVQVDWPQLWQTKALHIKKIAVQKLKVNMDAEPAPEDPNASPFTLPHLPIAIALDSLYVGAVYFTQQGKALPVDLHDLDLQLNGVMEKDYAQVQIDHVGLDYEDIHVDLKGVARLTEFAAPWSSAVNLQGKLHSKQEDSQICLGHYLPAHLQKNKSTESVQLDQVNCEIDVKASWLGSLDKGVVEVHADGQGLQAQAESNLHLGHPFPLRETTVVVDLPDGSSAQLALHWEQGQTQQDRLYGEVALRAFDVGAWLPEKKLAAKLSASATYEAKLSESATQLDQASIDMQVEPGSVWNALPVKGHVRTGISRIVTSEQIAKPEIWQIYAMDDSDIDLQVGANKVELKGAFGVTDHQLRLQANLPAISSLWPGLSEVGATQVNAELKGSLYQHQLKIKAEHLLQNKKTKAKVGNGPVKAELNVSGQWKADVAQPSWQAKIHSLHAEHAGIGMEVAKAVEINVSLPAEKQALGVVVGAFDLQLFVDKQRWIALHNQRTEYSETGIKTKGYTDTIAFSTKRVELLMKRLGLEKTQPTRGGVVDKRKAKAPLDDLAIKLDWDVSLTDALSGSIRLKREAGDIMVPAEPEIPLGLEQAEIVVNMKAGSGGRSVVSLDAQIYTKDMGFVKLTGNTPIYYSKAAGIQIRNQDVKELVLDAQMDNLAWTNLILQDQVDLGGALNANVRLRSTPTGGFTTQGKITGKNLKVTRLDDGVRLLDGELDATLTDNRFTINKLYFPAQLRVEPKEWRTATWIRENAQAQDGSLLLTGYWDLEKNDGNFKAELYRYPILQRADRYAMVSGQLQVNAALPHIAIDGKITADAGWFNLDMLGGIPTVDSDVVVIRSTDPVKTKEQEGDAPIDMTMNLEVDLGPRFYLTGYGVDSGLVGQLQIHMNNGQITALGALNTRGGAISIYGQRLQLRRGTVTFQGDIVNPLLDIQALRTGLSVEAGVKVGGTARKPKIDLISNPEVSELEKLSWLLFGHGPDDSSGDIALLLSVGTSFLGDGEPFYRRFGIDELTMRSGELGGSGSILPATSTASSTESEISEVERRFVEASKALTSDITVSIRQALADTGTVGRASYRLSRRLTAELSVGTVSGLALIYRWFSKD